MRRCAGILTALLGILAVLALSPPTTAHATPVEGTDPSWATCTQYTVPVTLSATDATSYNLVGRLCLRDDSQRGSKTVELLVSGLTYDHNYFNPAYLPNTYSYVYAATSKGYSTFNIDRLGVGLSSHPAPEKLTLQSHAYVVAQIVSKLRAGAIGGRAFTTVVGVGHSFGAAILQYLAGTATDASTVPNYLVLMSFLFSTYTPGLTALGGALYPATSDPAFASSGLPADYLTTQPNTRGSLFYHTAGAEAAAISFDEGDKQTGTTTERTSLGLARTQTITLGVKVPVLIVVGQYDNLYCDEASGLTCANNAAVKAREAANYGARACMSAYVELDAGHSVNLHIKARDAYNFAHSWLDKYTITGTKDANGCVA